MEQNKYLIDDEINVSFDQFLTAFAIKHNELENSNLNHFLKLMDADPLILLNYIEKYKNRIQEYINVNNLEKIDIDKSLNDFEKFKSLMKNYKNKLINELNICEQNNDSLKFEEINNKLEIINNINHHLFSSFTQLIQEETFEDDRLFIDKIINNQFKITYSNKQISLDFEKEYFKTIFSNFILSKYNDTINLLNFCKDTKIISKDLLSDQFSVSKLLLFFGGNKFEDKIIKQNLEIEEKQKQKQKESLDFVVNIDFESVKKEYESDFDFDSLFNFDDKSSSNKE